MGHSGCLSQPWGVGKCGMAKDGQRYPWKRRLHLRKGFAEDRNVTQNHPCISEHQLSLPSCPEKTQPESKHRYLGSILNVLSREKERKWGAVQVWGDWPHEGRPVPRWRPAKCGGRTPAPKSAPAPGWGGQPPARPPTLQASNPQGDRSPQEAPSQDFSLQSQGYIIHGSGTEADHDLFSRSYA